MKFKCAYLSLFTILISFSSCLKDTCNGNLGNTFNTITFDSTITDSINDLSFQFSWSVLDDLPENYFVEVITEDSITMTQVKTYYADKNKMIITLHQDALPEIGNDVFFSLTFLYGDRRNYIECSHPGSFDRYYLDIKFKLENMDNIEYHLAEFEWSEIFAAGHL